MLRIFVKLLEMKSIVFNVNRVKDAEETTLKEKHLKRLNQKT